MVEEEGIAYISMGDMMGIQPDSSRPLTIAPTFFAEPELLGELSKNGFLVIKREPLYTGCVEKTLHYVARNPMQSGIELDEDLGRVTYIEDLDGEIGDFEVTIPAMLEPQAISFLSQTYPTATEEQLYALVSHIVNAVPTCAITSEGLIVQGEDDDIWFALTEDGVALSNKLTGGKRIDDSGKRAGAPGGRKYRLNLFGDPPFFEFCGKGMVMQPLNESDGEPTTAAFTYGLRLAFPSFELIYGEVCRNIKAGMKEHALRTIVHPYISLEATSTQQRGRDTQIRKKRSRTN